MYQEQKAAQIAAFFVAKEGGRLAHLKLMKLMYLAERESLRLYGFPMIGDKFVAMQHGPVLSKTLDHIDGNVQSAPDGWDAWISDKADHCVGIIRPASRDDLEDLSDADLGVLETIWQQFGHMTRWQIRDYTHEHCAEWASPGGGMRTIPYPKVLEALGYSSEQAIELVSELRAQLRIELFLQV